MKALSRKQGDGREGVVEGMETGLARFREEMDRAIERMWRGGWPSAFSLSPQAIFGPQLESWMAWPAIDVHEDEKGIVIRADIPGVDAKDVAVEVAESTLTIRGSREEEKEEKKGNVRQHERRFGRFERTITLPPHIDEEKVEAKYHKGTLTVTAPRIPGKAPKRVDVKAS
jgi:HSP20 family protein